MVAKRSANGRQTVDNIICTHTAAPVRSSMVNCTKIEIWCYIFVINHHMSAMDALPTEIISMVVDCMHDVTAVKFMQTCHRFADVYFAREACMDDIIAELRYLRTYYTCRCGRVDPDAECGICMDCMPQTRTCAECDRVNFSEFFQRVEYDMLSNRSDILHYSIHRSTVCHKDIGCQFACNHCGERRPSIHNILVNHAGDVYCKDCVRSYPQLQQEPLYYKQFHNGASKIVDFTSPHWYDDSIRAYYYSIGYALKDGKWREYTGDTIDPSADKWLPHIWIFHVSAVDKIV